MTSTQLDGRQVHPPPPSCIRGEAESQLAGKGVPSRGRAGVHITPSAWKPEVRDGLALAGS